MLPPDAPPLPIALRPDALPPTARVRVLFDRPLKEGPIGSGNWKFRVSDLFHNPATVVVQPAAPFYVDMSNWGPPVSDPGPNFVEYSPPKFDLLGQNGLPVAAFVFP